MTPAQRTMCRRLREAMAEFYSDPENERRFEQWRSSRRGQGAPMPASESRAPSRFAVEPSQS